MSVAKSRRLETKLLTKSFGDFTAVQSVSINFEPGRIHAVLGENGAGKTTLMKLLFGLYEPTSGSILLDGQEVQWRSSMDAISHGLGMVQQHFTLVEPMSAIDNIMIGAETTTSFGKLNRKAAIAKLESLLPSRDLAVPWLTPVSEMTVGQKQRVEILKLLFREAGILFLDEPTAVLTPQEIKEFFAMLRKLRDQGRTIVLITHKLNEVMDVCDSYKVLRRGELVAEGDVATASVEKIVESMIGRKLSAFDIEHAPAKETKVLECRNLRGVSHTRGALQGLDLKVHAGEIVGIAGVDGSGQGHLVESIFGLRDFEGNIKVLGEDIAPFETRRVRELGVGLVPEDRHHEGLWMDESCSVNMMIGLEDRFLKNSIFQFDELEKTTRAWADGFDVRTSSLSKRVGSLSGGNQQKIIFAREVTGRTPKLLVCHQPTRGVDLGAIDLIHRRLIELRNDGMGILCLSSELEELLKICDRIYVFYDGRVTAELSRQEFDTNRIGCAMAGVVNAE